MTVRGHLKVLSLLTALSLAGVAAGPAAADLRQDLQADVLASGFSDMNVAVDPVAPAAFVLDEELEADLTFSDLRPFLATDPEAPGAVPTFTLRVARAAPLEGVLQTPGVATPTYTTLAPRAIEAELAAYQAAKHAILRGEDIAGTEFVVEVDGEITSRTLISAPGELTYVAPPSPSMSSDEIEQAVRDALPAWAAGGTVSVRDDYASERIVTLNLERPAESFRVVDVDAVALALGRTQVALAPEGGNIGRVIVHVEDVATGDPLYSAGQDLVYGSRRAAWRSPLISGFEPVTAPLPPVIDQLPDDDLPLQAP